MRFATLPEKNSKDEPRIEEIKNVKLRVDADKKPIPVEFKVAAPSFKFKQFDNWVEVCQDAGSEEAAIKYVNSCFGSDAVAAAKNQMRNATTASDKENYTDVITSALKACENYTLNQPETLTVKDRANAFDQLAALANSGNVTPEQLLEQLKALAGR